MKRKINILLTSVGGIGVPKVIETLRAQEIIDFRITGIDMRKDIAGSYFVDEFICVPHAETPEYIDLVLEICRCHGIELIVPQSDLEALVIAESEEKFALLGCKILVSSYATTRLAINKFDCLCRLRDLGIPVPRFHRPGNTEELETALADLQFPERSVVFKPAALSGSRGFRLISAHFDEFDHIMTAKAEVLMSAERLRRLVHDAELRDRAMPEFILMEHLQGACYSVDVLVKEGRVAYVIPQRRISPDYGSVQDAIVESDANISNTIERIVAAIPFRHVFNVDMAYQRTNREGEVFAFDINPRVSATILATHAAGCFLLLEAIQNLFGIETSPKEIQRIRSIRFWNEIYVPLT